LRTPKNVKKSLKILEKDDQKVIFLGMVHLVKPGFYQQAKIIIDSLRKENYTIFYEGIKYDKKFYKAELDSLELEELYLISRKYRKMIGQFHAGDLTDRNNKSLPNYYKNKKYVTQTNELLGIDSLDINADSSIETLIKAQEEKNGKIILTECDYNTNFKEKYNCDKVNSYYAINIYRDRIVSNIVLKTNKQKSLIIYVKGHWYGIWPFFRDEGFKEIE